MIEARAGNLPTRTKMFDDVEAEFKTNSSQSTADGFAIWRVSLADARTPPLVLDPARSRPGSG